MIRPTLALIVAAVAALASPQTGGPRLGHSKHGTAFDTGMRTKPWKIEGIGSSPFKITTANPEVQEFYDQGNALLHSFWFEEAERSFRWCHKLEPENAMVYFGLAQCGINWFTMGSVEDGRYRDFLREAVKRKHTVSERERMYIEAWDAACAKTGDEARNEIVVQLQRLCVRFPDDIEAKCQLAFYNIGKGSALANEFLIRQVLAVNPGHPGAHHARIHNWDGALPDQALDSCEQYGRVAPGIGHALHMPGHVYTKVGMWHEAAIAMDSATRAELRYMNDRMALPFEAWNYAHNRDYLCYIQEQLGRAEASIQGALDMQASPRPPGAAMGYPAVIPLLRALLKFERWEQILDGQTLAAADPSFAPLISAAQVVALVGQGKTYEARERLKATKAGMAKMMAEAVAANPAAAEFFKAEAEKGGPLLLVEAEALLTVAEGDRLGGIRQLLVAAAREEADRKAGMYPNDPPMEPWTVYRLVGDTYFDGGDFHAAAEAYERGLVLEPNDGWCLAGLAKSYAKLGDKERARGFAGRLLAVWSGADPGLSWLAEVQALGLGAKPAPVTPRPERAYDPAALDAIGPSNWHPFAAPALDCTDAKGERVSLESLRGKNVLLVFYLSDECVHCMEQLVAIDKRRSEFEAAETVVLAVSAAKPDTSSGPLAPLGIRLLHDADHANARRFASYDDFEDMELHSTFLIDKQGRVRWKQSGGDPFGDVEFLLGEIRRWR